MTQLRKHRILFLTFLLASCLLRGFPYLEDLVTEFPESMYEAVAEQEEVSPFPTAEELHTLADANPDAPYLVLNQNQPFFTESEYTTEAFESYSDLDELGRCGQAYACIGTSLMPTEERGQIGAVRPSGWHTVKYDIVDGKYLYNRCHLIGYQLAGENANEKNLITGTRYLNVIGMLPFENEVADYVKRTDNHVLYRVTPIYTDDHLLADGLVMEGLSVEDQGDGICFAAYVPNRQPGITIDYATGDSWLTDKY